MHSLPLSIDIFILALTAGSHCKILTVDGKNWRDFTVGSTIGRSNLDLVPKLLKVFYASSPKEGSYEKSISMLFLFAWKRIQHFWCLKCLDFQCHFVRSSISSLSVLKFIASSMHSLCSI